MTADFGSGLPVLVTEIPGPRSRALAQRLARVESRNITRLEPTAPIFWAEARGANVRDVDGNTYIDLTAGFGVAAAGHAPPEVAAAIAAQAAALAHGLGDVYPARVKVELLEKLAAIAPGNLSVSILASAGAEAVEAALKTAVLRTGRPGILAFEGSYHGLTYGALAATHRNDFRAPFEQQLFSGVRFAPLRLDAVDELLRSHDIGAILIEPVQGRGGIRMMPDGFLQALRARCDGERRILIFDEIYTGMGRTGQWFACQHFNVVPDVLVVGKGLTGSLPLSAAIGTPDLMQAWPPSHGEAIHTSTFLGNPIACAAALAQIDLIERNGLLRRAQEIGARIHDRVKHWPARAVRGLGALQGVEFHPATPPVPVRLMQAALADGIIVLPEGPTGDVLALTPPLTVTNAQLDYALAALERLIRP